MSSTQPNLAQIPEDLISRAKLHREAFGELFDLYYPRIINYCWRRLGERSAAEDLTSEVFLKVARSIRQFPSNTVHDFTCWIYRIASNEVHASQRTQGTRAALLQQVPVLSHNSPEDSSDAETRLLQTTRLTDALSSLNSREQTIVTLRFFENLSYEQIGTALDLQPGAVRTAMSRALGQLRNHLGSLEI